MCPRSAVGVRSLLSWKPSVGMRNRLVFVVTLGLAAALSAPAAEDAGGGAVWLVELDGAVGPASADLVIRAIEDAGAADAQALVIRMDTPGGLDKSMRDLVKAILGSEIPVITYVSPSGARAASAGTYIAYASHVAAMAPATNIGSSTPVSIAPQQQPPRSPSPWRQPPAEEDRAEGKDGAKDAEEGEGASGSEAGGPEEGDGAAEKPAEADRAPPPADAMTRKVINDAVAYLQSLAELRGRNVEWAEKTVRDGDNLRASAALEQNVIDIMAPNLAVLLEELDGREVEVGDEVLTLATAEAELVRVETDWRHELLSIITDPSIAYGLLIIGVYLLMLEFYNPGIMFPAVTGIICLLLGAYGLQMLPVNYAGLALIAVGIGMLILEVMTPTYGVLGVGGVVAFVIGSIILVDSDLPGYQLPIAIIAGFAAATGGVAFFIVGAAVRARAAKVVSGVEGMVGGSALVLEDFQGQGAVRVFGEIWRASSAAPLAKDTRVKITGVDGLLLSVEAEGKPEDERGDPAA